VEALLAREAERPGESIHPEEATPLRLAVDLDGKDVTFEGLQADDCWVARAPWDDVVVCLVGLRWPHENLTLVSISDTAPYFQGRAWLLPALEGSGEPDEEDDD
jgi:hypothetical protein